MPWQAVRRVVVGERVACGDRVPRIVEKERLHPHDEREVPSDRERRRVVLDDELPVRKDAVMRDDVRGRVRRLVGIDGLADRRDRGMIALLHHA